MKQEQESHFFELDSAFTKVAGQVRDEVEYLVFPPCWALTGGAPLDGVDTRNVRTQGDKREEDPGGTSSPKAVQGQERVAPQWTHVAQRVSGLCWGWKAKAGRLASGHGC